MEYIIDDEDIKHFEVWLELYLFHNLDSIQPAFAKVEIVKTLRESYLKEDKRSSKTNYNFNN